MRRSALRARLASFAGEAARSRRTFIFSRDAGQAAIDRGLRFIARAHCLIPGHASPDAGATAGVDATRALLGITTEWSGSDGR
jgi:hypothetical protein